MSLELLDAATFSWSARCRRAALEEFLSQLIDLLFDFGWRDSLLLEFVLQLEACYFDLTLAFVVEDTGVWLPVLYWKVTDV